MSLKPLVCTCGREMSATSVDYEKRVEKWSGPLPPNFTKEGAVLNVMEIWKACCRATILTSQDTAYQMWGDTTKKLSKDEYVEKQREMLATTVESGKEGYETDDDDED